MKLGIHAMMIMSEFMIQPCALIAIIRRLYLSNLVFDGFDCNFIMCKLEYYYLDGYVRGW
jgi:hypothetical protein